MRRAFYLMCIAAACGDDGVHHLADGSTDGPPVVADAPAPKPVTLTVTLNGQPSAGNVVYFQNADSSLVASMMTDANGKASTVMDAGGFVTLIEPSQPTVINNANLDTFSAVQPGDDLHVDLGEGGVNPTGITFNLTVPTDPDINAVGYFLFSSCGQVTLVQPAPPALRAKRRALATTNNAPVQVQLFGCGATADMIIESTDDVGNPLNSFYVPAQAVADQQDVTLTGTYAPLTAQTFTYANVTSAISNVTLDEEVFSANGFLTSQFTNGGGVGSGTSDVTINTSIPATTGTTAILDQEFDPSGDTIFDFQQIIDWGPVPGATTTLDYGATQLSDFTDTPSYDTSLHHLTWPIGPTGAVPDAVLANLSVSRVTDPTTGATTNWFWSVGAPGTSSTNVAFPTLPNDVFDFNVQQSDTFNVNFIGAAKVPGGYDTIRPHIFTFDPSQLAVAGTTGRAILESLQVPAPTLAKAKPAPSTARPHGKLAKMSRWNNRR